MYGCKKRPHQGRYNIVVMSWIEPNRIEYKLYEKIHLICYFANNINNI